MEQWFSIWTIKYYRCHLWKWIMPLKVQIILKQILVVRYLRIDWLEQWFSIYKMSLLSFLIMDTALKVRITLRQILHFVRCLRIDWLERWFSVWAIKCRCWERCSVESANYFVTDTINYLRMKLLSFLIILILEQGFSIWTFIRYSIENAS